MRKQNFYFYGGVLVLSLTVACSKTNSLSQSNATQVPAVNGNLGNLRLNAIQSAPSGYTLAYEEDFNNNRLNTSDWYYRERKSKHYIGNGWLRRENVSVVTQDGTGYLNIAYTQDKDWDGNGTLDLTGGGVITTKTFGYGYYEARIKFYNATPGLHESFWTHGLGINTFETDGTEYNDAASRDLLPIDNRMIEIDDIELDSYNNTGKTNFWFNSDPSASPRVSNSGAFARMDPSYMDLNSWINVGFEWLPNTVNYYINGVLRHTYTYNTVGYAAMNVWLTALANQGYWYPNSTSTTTPGASMKVDYFRYYNKPINTNLIGNNSFEFGGGKSSEQVISWVVYDNIHNDNTTDGVRVVNDGTAYDGVAYLEQDGKTAVPIITTKHQLNYIPNGNYRLTAWVKKTAGMTHATMRAMSIGSGDRYVDIPTSSQWTQITLDNINITSNQAVIGFTTTGPDGEFLKVDKVELHDKQFN